MLLEGSSHIKKSHLFIFTCSYVIIIPVRVEWEKETLKSQDQHQKNKCSTEYDDHSLVPSHLRALPYTEPNCF